MEFLLVPLLAIAAATFCIYKLAELVFHIRLSGKLLLMLVVFAWLISLVLPGLFFHSAGFLGSVWISLISAAGFAWLAATYDVRAGASVTGSPEADQDFRTDTAVALAVLPVTVPIEQYNGSMSVSSGGKVSGPDEIIREELETGDSASAECAAAEAVPETDGFPMETVFEVPIPEYPIVGTSILRQALIQKSSASEVSDIESAEMENVEKPESDSLEDLLEFAFAQRDRHHETSALETFRLIKHLYSDSDAFPMVVAEIVSTLQSQGDYAGASAELTAILQLPEIRQRSQLFRIFEQKLSDIQTNIDHEAR